MPEKQPAPVRITREQILNQFLLLPDGAETTTRLISYRLGCKEHQVRACISWLKMGGLLVYCGKTIRYDSEGRKYTVNKYQWTGKQSIFRVPRNELERKIIIEQRSSKTIQAFLSKKW